MAWFASTAWLAAAASPPPAASLAASTPVQACPEPKPAAVDGPWGWSAEPGLEWVARSLARDPASDAPLPALGRPHQAVEAGLRVYVLRDLTCTEHLDLPSSPDWVAGLASLDRNVVVLRADPERDGLPAVRSVFRHEIAHVALHGATGGNAPRWLHEGYAQYASGTWDWQQAWRLRLAILGEGRSSLSSLSLRFPAGAANARIAYLASYTAVQELLASGGEAGLSRLFETLASSASADEALRAVYGLTEAQFEQRWRAGVADRYGILYVLSRAGLFWAVVTILVMALGWRRRRRDKERRAILAARDAEQDEAWLRAYFGGEPR